MAALESLESKVEEVPLQPVRREITARAKQILTQFPTRPSRLRAFDEQGLLMSGEEAWLMLPESDEHPLLHRLGRAVIRYSHAGIT